MSYIFPVLIFLWVAFVCIHDSHKLMYGSVLFPFRASVLARNGYLIRIYSFSSKVISVLFLYNHCMFSTRYVPAHLHLMVFELVKNSLRAVQERFIDSDNVAPPVRIIVADGLEDVTIKVHINFCSEVIKFFTYLFGGIFGLYCGIFGML